MDLPHTFAGYMQVEETDFRRSTDEQVYQKLGSNINYLLDLAAGMQVQATTLFNNSMKAFYTGQGFTTDTNGNYGAIIDQSPNGNPIVFVAALNYVGGYRNANPLVVFPGSGLVAAPMFTGSGSSQSDTGTMPQIQLSITGPNNNQLYIQVVNGSNSTMKGTMLSWAANTGGAIYYSLVYQNQ